MASGSKENVDASMRAGFSRAAAETLAGKYPERSLDSDDLPPAIASSIKHKAAQFKQDGIQEIAISLADEIINIEKHIVGISSQDENLSFSLSKVPREITDNYTYIGYSFPGSGMNKYFSNDTVRRVFQSMNSASTLVIEEQSLQHGNAVLLSAFVNTNVFEYPAIFSIMKVDSGASYETLNWVSKNFAFILYAIGPSTGKEYLVSLAEELTDINDHESIQSADSDYVSNTPAILR